MELEDYVSYYSLVSLGGCHHQDSRSIGDSGGDSTGSCAHSPPKRQRATLVEKHLVIEMAHRQLLTSQPTLMGVELVDSGGPTGYASRATAYPASGQS